MASTSETGHAVNVANFEELITFVTSYGSRYNPANNQIKIPGLTTVHTNSKAALTTLNDRLPTLTTAINTREELFEPLSPLITRVVNAAEASSMAAQAVKDLKTIARKLQGRRAKPVTAEAAAAEESANKISASQLSFDQRIENLDKLILFLAAERDYTPNETDLTTDSLRALHQRMVSANTAVGTARAPVSNARIARNHLLYDLETGLVSLSLKVKSYVKSVYGANAPEYKQVRGLQFTRLKK